MSAASSAPTIEQLREEFESRGISGWLWDWLLSALEAYVRVRLRGRYRAAVYSPSGAWDEEGIRDLVNEFIVERVEKKQALLRGLVVAENTAGLVHYLERSLHNFAVSERVRTVAGNIFVRLVDALKEAPELRPLARIGGREAYGLAEWAGEGRDVLAPEDVAHAVRHIPPGIEWREYHSGERRSPGLLSEDLLRIARSVIAGTGRLVTAGQLMQVVRDRFNLAADESAPAKGLDSEVAIGAQTSSPLESIVVEELARRAISTLTPTQKRVLAAWVGSTPPPTVREIAEQLQISKSLVSRHQQQITAAFRELHIVAEDERSQVLSATARLLEG